MKLLFVTIVTSVTMNLLLYYYCMLLLLASTLASFFFINKVLAITFCQKKKTNKDPTILTSGMIRSK